MTANWIVGIWPMVHKRENRVKAGSRRSKNTWNGGEGVKGRGERMGKGV